MQMKDSIKGHLLDLKISGATEKHINEVKRELERFRVWCEAQGVTMLNEASHVVLNYAD